VDGRFSTIAWSWFNNGGRCNRPLLNHNEHHCRQQNIHVAHIPQMQLSFSQCTYSDYNVILYSSTKTIIV